MDNPLILADRSTVPSERRIVGSFVDEPFKVEVQEFDDPVRDLTGVTIILFARESAGDAWKEMAGLPYYRMPLLANLLLRSYLETNA